MTSSSTLRRQAEGSRGLQSSPQAGRRGEVKAGGGEKEAGNA